MDKPIKTSTTKLMLFFNFIAILLLVVGFFSIAIPVAYGIYILLLILITIVTFFLLLLNERFRSLYALQPNMELVFLLGNIGFIGAGILSLSTLMYFIFYKKNELRKGHIIYSSIILTLAVIGYIVLIVLTKSDSKP